MYTAASHGSAKEVDKFLARLAFKAKDPCGCAHQEGLVFHTRSAGDLTVSICDHCIAFQGSDYRMPPEFYREF